MANQILLLLIASFCLIGMANAAQEDSANSTTLTKKLFTYAGPLLPPDWQLVSILNERVVIGFNNGSARNALLDDLEPKDKSFIQRLQNGTVYSTPLASAKEKIVQWSSSVSSTVSKFGKSIKDNFDSFVNNKDKNNSTSMNVTTVVN